jgi:hypothetical protein
LEKRKPKRKQFIARKSTKKKTIMKKLKKILQNEKILELIIDIIKVILESQK